MPGSPRTRCPWCGDDPLLLGYHDTEWGVPQRDPHRLFEALILDAFQAGLAWITVLRKRENLRAAFAGFDPERVAGFVETDIQRLLNDPGVIRHRGKIEAAIAGARAWIAIEEREGFSRFLWNFVDGVPCRSRFRTLGEVPAQTPLSDRISKALRAEGFRFVGPTSVYAFLQGAGLVNDHLVDCFRHGELANAA